MAKWRSVDDIMHSSPGHASSRYFLTNNQKDQLRSVTSRIVFHPNSPFIKSWDLLMFSALIMTGIIEPCVFVFNTEGFNSQIYYWFTIILFTVDIVIRCLRAQRKSTRDGVVLVTHVPEIIKMYMRDWMCIVDVLSAFPLTWICVGLGLANSSTGHALGSFRMIRFFKFARLPELLHRMHDVTGWSFSTLSICQFGVISSLVLHWIACLWAYLGRMGRSTWLDGVQENFQFLDLHDATDTYLISFYWAITVLSSVGFGDITPHARIEFFWAIISMAIGGTVWAYVVGSVCGMATNLDKHRTAFEAQINDVNIMCVERDLPADLSERVRDFYQHAKQFMRMQLYHETIRQLSPALKGEVVSWMYGSCFRRVWYFDVLDEKGARLLSEGMVPKMYAPEELVEDSIEGTRCLVFLRSGLCVRKCNLLAPGAVWGLDVILGSEEHDDIEHLLDVELARSINFAFVLKLSKVHIDHAANVTPTFARRLRKAHLRMLFWRGVIAASRAINRLEKGDDESSYEVRTPAWDKAGKQMAQVVHLDRLLLDKKDEGCGSRGPMAKQVSADSPPRRSSSTHIHTTARRASKAVHNSHSRGSIGGSARSSVGSGGSTRTPQAKLREQKKVSVLEHFAPKHVDAAVQTKEARTCDQMIQVDRSITEQLKGKATKDQGIQVELVLEIGTPPISISQECKVVEDIPDNSDRAVASDLAVESPPKHGTVSSSCAASPTSLSGSLTAHYSPGLAPRNDPTYFIKNLGAVVNVPRKPIASIKVKPGLPATSTRPRAKQATESPPLAERLRRVYTTMQGDDVEISTPTQSRWSGLPDSPCPLSSRGTSPVLAANDRQQEGNSSPAQQGAEANEQVTSLTNDLTLALEETAIMKKGRVTMSMDEFSNNSAEVSPSEEKDERPRRKTTFSLKRGRVNSEMEESPDPSPSRRKTIRNRRDIIASEAQRDRSESDLDDENSPSQKENQKAWRKEVEKKLDDLGEDLEVMNDGIVEDFDEIRDELAELTRMMHQLLMRFDAEEKY